MIYTSWIKPINQIGGLDHLGVQAPCIDIYGQLLPGITNVTDRARYYSFYSWVFWVFDQKGWSEKSLVVDMFRKADCLFTLIAARHDQVIIGSSNFSLATVGKNTLEPQLKKQSIRLSDFSHQNSEDNNRYFKSKFGGFGQYYYGSLRDLNIFGGKSVDSAVLIKEVGGKIAEVFNQGVPTELFLEVLIKDEVTLKELDNLLLFSPENLCQNLSEKSMLTQLFLLGIEPLVNDSSELDVTADKASAYARANTMAFQLQLIKHANENSQRFNLELFRTLIYCQHGIDGKPFGFINSISESSKKWQIYSRCELISIALQGLFYALLQPINSERYFASTNDLSTYFWEVGVGSEVLKGNNAMTSQIYFGKLEEKLPSIANWQNSSHEIQSIKYIIELTEKPNSTSDEDLVTLVKHCLKVLAALCNRVENKAGYDQLTPSEEYLARYPVNLHSVTHILTDSFKNENISKTLIIFCQQYCLENHWHVAMRKLRHQGKNTFRFEFSERGLIVNDIPKATHTSPRFYQSIQIMQDLGLIEKSGDVHCLTPCGEKFIEGVL
ncbi:hypothetical protein ACU5EH_15470 [Aliivibrio salmonicida]|uniref:hypothetical protein n=1 Tax=Aliivibrio salmonicida TaxID=40269 RepID=UPI00406D29E3